MYVPEKMRQNEFKELICPCPRDLYERIGPRIPSNTGSSDGSEYSEVVSFDNNKLNNLARSSYEDYKTYSAEMEAKNKQPIKEENVSVEV